MFKKIAFSIFLVAFVFSGVGTIQNTYAQTSQFSAGCTSALGYSVTTGAPCNGTATATMNIPGCATALGYSLTTGIPCDGSSVAIQYLAGCSSVNGFSNISGSPCNGTNSIEPISVTVTTPGLPVTGAGSNALVNMIVLASSAVVAIVGATYLVKKYKVTA